MIIGGWAILHFLEIQFDDGEQRFLLVVEVKDQAEGALEEIKGEEIGGDYGGNAVVKEDIFKRDWKWCWWRGKTHW